MIGPPEQQSLLALQEQLLQLLQREHQLLLSADAQGQVELLELKAPLLAALEQQLKEYQQEQPSSLVLDLRSALLERQQKLEQQNKRNLQLTLRLHRELSQLIKSFKGESSDVSGNVEIYNRKRRLNHQTTDPSL